MGEDEYKDNEKVIYKTKCKLCLSNKIPEEADCFITDNHMIIDAKEPVSFPVLNIRGCYVTMPRFTADFSLSTKARSETYPTDSTLTIKLLDQQERKQKLSLEGAVLDMQRLKESVDSVRPPEFFKKVDSEKVIIAPSLGYKFRGMIIGSLLFILFLWLAFYYLPLLIFLVVLLYLYLVGGLLGFKIIVDILARNIVIKHKIFLLFPKQRIIPFEAITGLTVECVTMEHIDWWKVIMYVKQKRVELYRSHSERDIRYLATAIKELL